MTEFNNLYVVQNSEFQQNRCPVLQETVDSDEKMTEFVKNKAFTIQEGNKIVEIFKSIKVKEVHEETKQNHQVVGYNINFDFKKDLLVVLQFTQKQEQIGQCALITIGKNDTLDELFAKVVKFIQMNLSLHDKYEDQNEIIQTLSEVDSGEEAKQIKQLKENLKKYEKEVKILKQEHEDKEKLLKQIQDVELKAKEEAAQIQQQKNELKDDDEVPDLYLEDKVDPSVQLILSKLAPIKKILITIRKEIQDMISKIKQNIAQTQDLQILLDAQYDSIQEDLPYVIKSKNIEKNCFEVFKIQSSKSCQSTIPKDFIIDLEINFDKLPQIFNDNLENLQKTHSV